VTACFDADFTLAAAAAFTLVGHARSDVNVDWLVVRCETRAQGARSSHRLHCVPLSQPHRPVLLPRPRIIGTQTAFVVGEPGREIDVDGHGRVCLKFHWDRRSDTFGTTRRVRVSQGWAGPGYGFVCLPRVGDEVVVEFLDGDPDQPLVVGRVHNGVAVAPQTLPEQQTRSTWRSRSSPGGDGFNEITLEDAAGAELVHLHAQRDAEVVVRNDARIHVGGHVDSNVKGNATGGVKGDGALTVQGDVDVTIGGNLDVTAANIDASANKIVFSAMGARVDESAAHHVSADGPFTVSAGATVFVTPLFIVMSQAISLAAAGSLIEMGERGITIKSSGPVTINGSVVKLNC
jgi:type VI secretion system secreted protein VgrG